MSFELFFREFENEFTSFVLKTEVTIWEITGLVLFACCHSVLNFTVQNGLHLFLQKYKAFLFTIYLKVKTPESS